MQLRSSLGILATPFPYLLAVIICTEAFGSPPVVMSDTAIVAASLNDGDYGRERFWACLAWGIAGPLASPIMSYAGDRFVFLAYACVSAMAIAAAWRLDFSFVNNDAESQLSKLRAASERENDGESLVKAVGGLTDEERRRSSRSEPGHHVNAVDVWAAEPGADLQACVLPAEVEHAANASSSGESAPAQDSASTRCEAGEASSLESGVSATVTEPLLAAHRDAASSGGDSSVADEPFWRRYMILLREPRMVVFLCKALVMGVRHSFSFLSCENLMHLAES
jgi:MFS_1 like family